MIVLVNGDGIEVPEHIMLNDLISRLKLTGKLAVELNQEIIPRSQLNTIKLKPNDNIEIVTAIGGG